MALLSDTAMWIAVGSAAGAGLLALLLALLVLLLSRRRSGVDTAQLEHVVSESNARLEGRLADLSDALESAREQGERAERLGRIPASLDLDTVLERALEVAGSLPDVDAAMLVLTSPDADSPLIATLGLSASEVASQPIAGPPEGPRPAAVGIEYRYGDQEPADGAIRGGLTAPLIDETDAAIGMIALFWRSARAPSERLVALLGELAAATGPAVGNARRFREARELADLDALTNLHNRRYFHETLAREAARSQRYNRRLALVVFDIDDFKAINDRIGHLAGDSVLVEVAARVRSVVRTADIACRVGGDEFAVILPESSLADAEQLYRRLQFAIASRASSTTSRLHISAGIAEVRPDDDAVTLFERADEALYRAKNAGKGRSVAANEAG